MQTSSLWTGRWGVLASAFFLLLAPMLIWALASPLGSVPDEPSHAIRAAAVVRGEPVSQQWAEHPSLAIAEVPRYVAQLQDRTCFAFHPRLSAACVTLPAGDPNEIVLTGTSAGNNGPLFYAIVGLPTLFLSGDVALYAMRFVNAILTAALESIERGWHVFPVHSVSDGVCTCRKADCKHAGKHPRTVRGLQLAASFAGEGFSPAGSTPVF